MTDPVTVLCNKKINCVSCLMFLDLPLEGMNAKGRILKLNFVTSR